MNLLTDEMECPNCHIPIPAYKAGEDGYRSCEKCGYMFGVLSRDNLLFLLTYDKTAKHRDNWKLEKAYHDTDWQQEYRDLSSPKVAIFWSLYRGMQLNRITFKEKLTLENLPWEVIDDKFNSYDIRKPVELWLTEYLAGLREPDDAH